MKKNLFFTLFLVLLFAGTNAQDIKFMGLDLNTNFETFCQKLKEKGLVLEASKLTTKEFKGTFAGYKNCEFIITCTDNTKVVKSVEVIFPFDNDEYERNRAWNDIIKQYEAKYGKYTIVFYTMSFVMNALLAKIMWRVGYILSPGILDVVSCSITILMMFLMYYFQRIIEKNKFLCILAGIQYQP